MTKFTQGPWVVGRDTENLLSGDKNHVYVVQSASPAFKMQPHLASVGSIALSNEETAANAILISTAPDMFEALEVILSICESKLCIGQKVDPERIISVVLPALKKSGGEK